MVSMKNVHCTQHLQIVFIFWAFEDDYNYQALLPGTTCEIEKLITTS